MSVLIDLIILLLAVLIPPCVVIGGLIGLILALKNAFPSLDDQLKAERIETERIRRQHISQQIARSKSLQKSTDALLAQEWQVLQAEKRAQEILKLDLETQIKEQLLKDIKSGKADFTPRDYRP